MLGTILIGLLIALAIYAAYSAKTPEGWDWKRGLAALGALAVAAWGYLSGLLHLNPPA